MSLETGTRIDEVVRRAAYRIIEGKGATYYGIGAGLARIVRAVRNDERVVLTVSTRTFGIADFPGSMFFSAEDCRLRRGSATLRPTLSKEEYRALTKSVGFIQDAAAGLAS